MISNPQWLYVPYIINILILVPVCYAMFFGDRSLDIFEGEIASSEGLLFLVGSLWLAILTGSMAGLLWPAFFAPIILIQIFYKSTWLLTYILPLITKGEDYPVGISICFILIIFIYPVIFWLSIK